MILTSSAMLNVKYLDMFQTTLPAKYMTHIKEFMNCEDIAMNVIVADYLAKVNSRHKTSCCIKVKSQHKIKKLESKNGMSNNFLLLGPVFYILLFILLHTYTLSTLLFAH